MAKVIKIYLFLILLITIITLHNGANAHPIAKNDLITGKDFLSIYIGREHSANRRQPTARRRNTQQSIGRIVAVTNDDMSTAESSYFNDYDHTKSIELTTRSTTIQTSKKKENEDSPSSEIVQKAAVVEAPQNNSENENDDSDDNEDEIIDPLVEEHSNFDSQKIVKLVTSGSKIIFLEESPTVEYTQKQQEDHNHESTPIETDKLSDSTSYEHESENKITNYQTSSDSGSSEEIKIISVRISSSETRSQPVRNQSPSPQQRQSIDHNHQLHPIDDSQNDKVNILISNVAKSDFSIEEKEPFTLESQQKNEQQLSAYQQKDSFNEESINIESILNVPVVSPSLSHTSNTNRVPHSLSIKPNSTSTSSRSSSSSSSSSRSSNGATTTTAATITNENDDDDTLPSIQTIIIHDQDYTHHKEGNARPRSVSYSSISQSVNPKWKSDLENHKLNRSQQIKQQQQQIKEQLQHVSSEPAPIKLPQPASSSSPSPQTYKSEPEQIYSEPAKIYSEASKVYGEPSKFYSEPSKVYSEPAKIYGEPEKIYSEPAKIYSEPSRIYSEPSKIYSKPSEIYGEPSKMYGEPSKVYSMPAGSVYTTTVTSTTMTTPRTTKNLVTIRSRITATTTTTVMPQTTTQKQFSHSKKVIFNLDKLPYDLLNAPAPSVDDEQKNYLFAPQLNNQRFHHFTRKSEDQEFQQGPLSVLQRTTNTNRNYNQNYQKQNYRPSTSLVKPSTNKLLTQLTPNSPTTITITTTTTTPTTTTTERSYHPTPEQNYEIDEAVSVMTNGQYHGIVTNPPKSTSVEPSNKDEQDPKVGFVVEGRNFRKYRVEEKTPDGFIVGEYGVVSNNDGSLRGVRYTADENISPNLIYEALMKFLSL